MWHKVIIVSALSLRDKDRLRDRESLTKMEEVKKFSRFCFYPYLGGGWVVSDPNMDHV